MQRITESKPKPHVTKALQKLSALGFDTTLLANTQYSQHVIAEAGTETVTAILENLSKHDASTRRRLITLHNVYPKHHEFTEKLHQLDTTNLAKAIKRLSFMAQTKIYLFWRKNT